jgi:hypothetical protein
VRSLAKSADGHCTLAVDELIVAINRQVWELARYFQLNVYSERFDWPCRGGFVGLTADSGNAGQTD